MKYVISVVLATLLIGVYSISSVLGAQSTADVSVKQEFKNSERLRILSDRDEGIGEEYKIGHGDIIGVSIYGEGDMSIATAVGTTAGGQNKSAGGINVRIDGRVSLKHIGDVSVEGMTLTETADYLKALYAVIYEDPVVTTVLIQNNSKRYTVMGKVAQSGVFLLEFPMNVVQVIAKSKGFTEWANSEVSVVRENIAIEDDELFSDNVLEFDYDDFLKGRDLEKNILIQSGDIIIAH